MNRGLIVVITQKMVITLMIICLAICIASIVKFVERERFTRFTMILSIFMPFLLLIIMADFFVHIYVKNFHILTLSKKILGIPRFVFHAIQLTPLIHTALIDALCYCFQKELNTKGLIFKFKLSIPARVATENLRERIFLTGKFA